MIFGDLRELTVIRANNDHMVLSGGILDLRIVIYALMNFGSLFNKVRLGLGSMSTGITPTIHMLQVLCWRDSKGFVGLTSNRNLFILAGVKGSWICELVTKLCLGLGNEIVRLDPLFWGHL